MDASFLPRLSIGRMSFIELIQLMYNRDVAEPPTPAETAPAESEGGGFCESFWEKLSAFGRWRAFR
jgi:hypothetical protein